jgi:hypothetical protein
MLKTEHIIINEYTTISNNNNVFTIEFKYQSYSLINSLLKTRLIQGGSTDEFYKTVTFKAANIKTLNQYLNDKIKKRGKKNLLIPEAAKAILDLVKQLEYLINVESKTIIGYSPNDIIIINDETFVFLNSELITDIDQDTEQITITWPFSTRDFFLSPELLKIKEIPSLIHFKTSYFSFACLIIYFLLGDDEFYISYLKKSQPEEVINELDNHIIKETKLYWFLSRCLTKSEKERSLILI